MMEVQDLHMWVVGNWKMNGSEEFVNAFFRSLSSENVPRGVSPVLCPPYPYIPHVRNSISSYKKDYSIGAQDLSVHEMGPYTGDVCGLMLQDSGCTYVLVGHAERKEDFSTIVLKISAAQKAGLCPIICVGEKSKGDFSLLDRQLHEFFPSKTKPPFLIAYEPLWAIGSTTPPSIEYIVSVLSHIRQHFSSLAFTDDVFILYGGSVTETFVEKILPNTSLQGILLGRASLSPSSWENFLHLVGKYAVTPQASQETA